MAADGSYCLFRCESLRLAVAVANVAEIAEINALVRLSLCPPRIAGLCAYHRQVVPVVKLGIVPSPAAPSTIEQPDHVSCLKEAVLIVQTPQGMWGILIDRQGSSLTLQPPLRHDRREDVEGLVTEGRIEHQGVNHALIDAEATWRACHGMVVNWYGLFNESVASPSPVSRVSV